MAMFDYKNLHGTASAKWLSESHQIAVYGATANVMGLPYGRISQWFADNLTIPGWSANQPNYSLPNNWRELTPAELNLPKTAVDFTGYYSIQSPITGHTATGPQAKILARTDENGQIDKLALSFAGTNSPVDLPDYFQLNEGTIAPNFEPLLQAIRQYAESQGLSGEDVLITGYSLGGGMTNIMARFKESLADGFFAQSDYIAHASPVIYDDGSVYNMGYENDVVFRIVGNEPDVPSAIAAGKPGLVNPDKMFDSTPDNIILFNDTYASFLWNISPFSILNRPFGWSAHSSGIDTDAIDRISQSQFYRYTHRDSTVVVDQLNFFSRLTSWVEDKASPTSDHHGTPAFLIGNEHNNWLKGGNGGDYLDGGNGNDTFRTGNGADRIDGGAGIDTLRLENNADNWHFYHLSDGTLFAHAQDGSGLKQAHNVEQIAFQGQWLSHMNPYTITSDGLIDHSHKILTFLNHNIGYHNAQEGSEGNDQLNGEVLFGQGGNDVLQASNQNSLLHGGEGRDLLLGGEGDDELYGAEDNDWLNGGGGSNTLYGGHGHDIFAFDQAVSSHTIMDFNAYAGDHDRLLFDRSLFADTACVADCTRQINGDLYIINGDFNLIIKNTSLAILEEPHHISIA